MTSSPTTNRPVTVTPPSVPIMSNVDLDELPETLRRRTAWIIRDATSGAGSDTCDKCGRRGITDVDGRAVGGGGHTIGVEFRGKGDRSGSRGGTGGCSGGSEGFPVAEQPKVETTRCWRMESSPQEFESVRRASERVTLNLSGTSFVTTRDTLMRDPCTYFAAMLRMQPACSSSEGVSAAIGEEEGGCGGDGGGNTSCEFFIDRDPTHFRHILNYLRDNYIGLESFGAGDLRFMEELLQEAQFFNVSGLCQDLSRR
ncbi:unnamed protein product [Choristocarpus tenellus]